MRMLKTLIAALALSYSYGSVFASTVCIVTVMNSGTEMSCDGAKSTYRQGGLGEGSLALKQLTDKGYKIISQSSGGGDLLSFQTTYTLTKD